MYFEKEDLRQAKQMSAIEFLKRYRPEELVRCSTGEYELRSHDSFKISESTSLWHWKSRDIGGKSALDYLVRVEGVPFTGAVQYLLKQEPPGYMPTPKSAGRKPFVLPPAAREEYRVELYLQSRGVSLDVIRYCISRGRLYESRQSLCATSYRYVCRAGVSSTRSPGRARPSLPLCRKGMRLWALK